MEPPSLSQSLFVCRCGCRPRAKYKGKGHDKQESTAVTRFTPHDIEVVTAYYGSGTGNLPPGLAKQAGLTQYRLDSR